MATQLGHILLLTLLATSIKFSEQDSPGKDEPILIVLEAEYDAVLSAFQRGHIEEVKRFQMEGVLEKYINAYLHDVREELMSGLYSKLHLLQTLLQDGYLSVPSEEFVKIYPKHGGLFNVSLVPSPKLVATFLINIKKVMESPEIGARFLTLMCTLPDLQPATVKYLLDSGVDINTTAVLAVAETGNLPVLKLLAERGASLDQSYRVPIQNHFFGSPPEFMSLFYGKDVSEDKGRTFNVTPLVVAAYSDRVEVARYLLDRLGNLTDAEESATALGRPVTRGDPELTQALLEHGADPNAKDSYGQSAMHRAAFAGSGKVLRILMRYHGDPQKRDDYGWTPLHTAAFFSSSKPLLQLLQSQGSDVNAATDRGFSPLNLAVAGRHLEFLFYLKKHFPLDPNAKHNLQPVTTDKGHAEAVRFLLDHGADVTHQDEVLGWSALHWAAAIGDLNVSKMLVENNRATLNLKSKTGRTPLETAEYFGMADVAAYLRTAKGSS